MKHHRRIKKTRRHASARSASRRTRIKFNFIKFPFPGLVILGILAVLIYAFYNRFVIAQQAGTLNRPSDPVVMTGANLPSLIGANPKDIVAFRFVSAAWQQVPVQVDERDNVSFNKIYSNTALLNDGSTELVYTDPNTFTGYDSDTTFDSNDEIVLMAKDTGDKTGTAAEPAGVILGSGVEVTVNDPTNTDKGYVYFFIQSGSLSQDAGAAYVNYQFNLLSGNYLATYNKSGVNPENTTAQTGFYSHHFSDRWINDELKVTVGGASGVDILDRHKNLFAPGDCTRSEQTFSDNRGVIIANKTGPVRAIRSVAGANSGPETQRDNIFYEKRQDIVTYLRVHQIGGILDFFDYSPLGSGLTYFNNYNTGGVAIDGVPETITQGNLQWELITGSQGSLSISHIINTTITGLIYQTYYLDNSTNPPDTQCTGDAYAYGSSGFWINQNIPCTDPRNGCTDKFSSSRVIYYEAPGLTVADAQSRNTKANNPLTTSTAAWNGSSPTATPTPTLSATSTPTPTPVSVTKTDDKSYSVRFDTWYPILDSQASGGGLHGSSKTNDTFTLKTTSSSTSLTVVFYKGPNQGQANVTIDGTSKGTIDLFSATPQYQVQQSYSGLTSAKHTVIVKVLGLKNTSSTGYEVRVDALKFGTTTLEDDNGLAKFTSWSGVSQTGTYGGTYHQTAASGKSVYFSFTGPQFTWITARGPAYGQAQIIVDGTALGGTIDLYNPTLQWQYGQATGGLSAGTHNVQIKALGTKNAGSTGTNIVFDGFQVP